VTFAHATSRSSSVAPRRMSSAVLVSPVRNLWSGGQRSRCAHFGDVRRHARAQLCSIADVAGFLYPRSEQPRGPQRPGVHGRQPRYYGRKRNPRNAATC